MSDQPPARFVDTPEALDTLCRTLRGAKWLALDTEFIREKTYYPQLCLIQIAGDAEIACVDPLALDSIEPLCEVLEDPGITKVFHAAGQDLEIFYYLRGRLPTPVFDTQIAASLLGYGEQVGYAALVKAVLGVELDKSSARTDWARRPLQDRQIRYAVDDVHYLRDVYHRLHKRLSERGRLEWMEDDTRRLTDPDTYRVEPLSAWQRVRSAGKLKRRQLNVLKHLAAWRENRAAETNRPRRWILSDDIMFNLAAQQPADRPALERVRGLESKTAARHGDTLLSLIGKALAEPESEWPALPRAHKPTGEQEALADLLTAVVRLKAGEHELSPAQLAGRADLVSLARGERDVALLYGWRAKIAGRAVLDVLEGRLRLASREGRPVLEPGT